MSDVGGYVTGGHQSSPMASQNDITTHPGVSTRGHFLNRRLLDFRTHALVSRAEISEMRRKLRNLRMAMSAADEKFMKLVREKRSLSAADNWEHILNDSFEELQAARDSYGLLEEQYNDAEEELDRLDYEISKIERAVIPPEDALCGSQSDNEDGTDVLSSDSEEDEWTAPDRSRETATILRDAYLSRLGDADITRESHSRLLFDYERLLEIKGTRNRLGLELMAEDQALVDTFTEEEAKILKELRQVEDDVERLRIEWIQHDEQQETQKNGTESDLWQDELNEATSSEYERFPLLLQKPEEDEDGLRKLLVDFDGTGNRITRWLMHKLRSSCSEVELLIRISREAGISSDDSEWQQDVVRFWYADSTTLPLLEYEPVPTIDATTILTAPLQQDSRLPMNCEGAPLRLGNSMYGARLELKCGSDLDLATAACNHGRGRSIKTF